MAGADWTQDPAVISIAPDGDGDVKLAVELALSIMLDRPIILIVAPGRPVPDRLARVADAIIEADPATDTGQEAIARFMRDRLAAAAGADDSPPSAPSGCANPRHTAPIIEIDDPDIHYTLVVFADGCMRMRWRPENVEASRRLRSVSDFAELDGDTPSAVSISTPEDGT